jgi:tetratricopeptide (TPR) repeat protein
LSGPLDLFISHDHSSQAEVKRLSSALAARGLSCCAVETQYGTELQPRMATAKVVLIWGSDAFFRSRNGQTHLALAWIACHQPRPTQPGRIVIINAEPGLKHIYPLALREHVLAAAPGLEGAPDATALAEKIGRHCEQFSGTLGGLYPAVVGGWREAYDMASRPSPHFAGRERELWDIHTALSPRIEPGPTDRCTPRRVVISAGAGQGKSTLAREYAFRFGAAYSGGVFRLSARDALPAASIRELAENPALKPQLLALLRELTPESALDDSTGLATVTASLESALTRDARPFLWIVDDIPEGINGPALQQWFAPDRSGFWGSTLLISRSQRYDHRAEPIHLPSLDDDAGFTLLTRGQQVTRPDERDAAHWLVDALGRHARFVTIAGGITASQRRGRRSHYGHLLHHFEKKNRLSADLVSRHPGAFPEGHAPTAATALADGILALHEPARNILLLAGELTDYPLPADFIVECFILAGLNSADHGDDRFSIRINAPEDEAMTIETGPHYVEAGARMLENLGLAELNDQSLSLYPVAIAVADTLIPAPGRQANFREAALQALYVVAESCLASGDWRQLAALAPHGHRLLGDIRNRPIDAEDSTAEITGRIRLALHLADMDLRHGARKRAIQLYRATNAYLVRAMALEPHNGSRQRDFARIQEQLGDLLFDQGELSSALDHFRKSLGVRSFMAKQDPAGSELLQDLLRHHGKIGKILITQQDYEAALQSYRAAHAITAKLAQETANDTNLQFDLAGSYERLAGIYSRLGNARAAMSALALAQPILETLTDRQPREIRFGKALAAVHNMTGDLLRIQDDLSGALNRYRMALSIAENTARLAPDEHDLQRDIAVCHDNLGETLSGLDDPNEAQNHFLACLSIADHPDNRPAFSGLRRRDIAVVMIKLGMLQETAKDIDGALNRYQGARSIIERLAIDLPDNEALREDLSWLRKKLDRLNDKKAAELRRRARETR